MPNQLKTVFALVLLIVTLTACLQAAPIATPQGEKEPQVSDTPTPTPNPVAQVCPTCAVLNTNNTLPQDTWPESKGLGIIGDSFYDEYQGDDIRGGSYHATTFNPVELLVHLRQFNLGPWGTRDEPRRTGFAYNWARSGATSTTMIEQGQHTGLAEQIRQGKVTYVWIGIGANDFTPHSATSAYQGIYEGRITDAELQAIIDTAVANITLAVETVQEAGAKEIFVAYFAQRELEPLIGQTYPDAVRRRRVADAIDAVNRGIQAMADEKNIVAFNQNEIGVEILKILEENRYLLVGDKRIDFAEFGDEPQFWSLADRRHLGTVMNGVSANWYFIKTFNEHLGMNIPLLSDEEILRTAGFREE